MPLHHPREQLPGPDRPGRAPDHRYLCKNPLSYCPARSLAHPPARYLLGLSFPYALPACEVSHSHNSGQQPCAPIPTPATLQTFALRSWWALSTRALQGRSKPPSLTTCIPPRRVCRRCRPVTMSDGASPRPGALPRERSDLLYPIEGKVVGGAAPVVAWWSAGQSPSGRTWHRRATDAIARSRLVCRCWRGAWDRSFARLRRTLSHAGDDQPLPADGGVRRRRGGG